MQRFLSHEAVICRRGVEESNREDGRRAKRRPGRAIRGAKRNVTVTSLVKRYQLNRLFKPRQDTSIVGIGFHPYDASCRTSS